MTPRATISADDRFEICSSLNQIEPRRGRSRPEIVESSVVLPAPLLPTSATASPSLTRSETFQSTFVSPYAASTSRTSSMRRLRPRGARATEVRGHHGLVAHHLLRRALRDHAPAVE